MCFLVFGCLFLFCDFLVEGFFEVVLDVGRPFEPVEVKPLLVAIPASNIAEAGSPHPSD